MTPALPDAPRFSLRHNGIAGRARLAVAGLRGNDALSAALERIAPGKGIERVQASAVTGNILILYDPALDFEDLLQRLQAILDAPRAASAERGSEARQAGGIWAGLVAAVRGLLGGSHKSEPAHAATTAVALRAGAMAARDPETLPVEWHIATAPEVAKFWRVSTEAGLAEGDATARLERYGANVLPEIQSRSALAMLGAQFVSLPVILLLGSAALSVMTGGIADAIVIGAVVALNAGIGFAMEYSAERTIRSMLEISEPEARVIRGGRMRTVTGDEVVPGDVLVISRGDAVVADARLLAAENLTIDEAVLTGESLPLEKSPAALEGASTALAERRNMLYRGTLATGGQGLAIVVATGANTEIGRIQSLLAESLQPETPLQRQMRELGTQLTWVVCGAAAATFTAGLLHGLSALEMARSAVSLAIAAVPEGLPTIATVCLAGGMRALLRHGVMARRLSAVEALGGVEALCFDKTGTLTWNRMSAVAVHAGMHRYAVSGATFIVDSRPIAPSSRAELAKLLDVCALCSEAAVELREGEWKVEGSPTEAALVRMAQHGGVEVVELRKQFPRTRVEHRTELRPYMITAHRLSADRELIALKGRPEEVLGLCEWQMRDGAAKRLNESDRREISAANSSMAGGGLRVLGAAYLEKARAETTGEFIWLGLVGMADPPRVGLREVMAEFRRAGVRPMMLTGDQAATAEAIAEALELNGDGASVFARVTPSEKLRIVRELQASGALVAMTGDGVNDAPALKAADVGIAMGDSGARVARGVADLLLMDDNVASLLPAIREGRTVHENLRKAVHYIAATNVSEVLTMFGSVAVGLGQPFNPRQLLWVNLITDVFPEIALAMEPPEPGIMSRPPRDIAKPVIGRGDYGKLGAQSGVLTTAALAAYATGLARYGPGAQAGTLAFLTLTSAQLIHGWSVRSEARGAHPPPNAAMNYGIAAGFALLLASQFIPGLTGLLGTVRIRAADAAVCAALSLGSFLANDAMKS